MSTVHILGCTSWGAQGFLYPQTRESRDESVFTLSLNVHLFFLSSDDTDGGGNYDVVNNAVIATPGPQNYRPQNASFRHSWEMNYQEAAIYLQVHTPWVSTVGYHCS